MAGAAFPVDGGYLAGKALEQNETLEIEKNYGGVILSAPAFGALRIYAFGLERQQEFFKREKHRC